MGECPLRGPPSLPRMHRSPRKMDTFTCLAFSLEVMLQTVRITIAAPWSAIWVRVPWAGASPGMARLSAGRISGVMDDRGSHSAPRTKCAPWPTTSGSRGAWGIRGAGRQIQPAHRPRGPRDTHRGVGGRSPQGRKQQRHPLPLPLPLRPREGARWLSAASGGKERGPTCTGYGLLTEGNKPWGVSGSLCTERDASKPPGSGNLSNLMGSC